MKTKQLRHVRLFEARFEAQPRHARCNLGHLDATSPPYLEYILMKRMEDSIPSLISLLPTACPPQRSA